MRCDCHVHVVGPGDRYPQLPTRAYLADIATLDTLRRLGATRGVTRFVIVQPSFYGTDNSLLLESLDALGGDGRGVAVVDPSAPQAWLDDLAHRGVRGVRLNLYSPAGRADAKPMHETFTTLAAVARRMRWHVEVIAPLDVLARHAEVLAGSPVPVVIDHYGVYGDATPETRRCAAPAGAAAAAACVDEIVGALSGLARSAGDPPASSLGLTRSCHAPRSAASGAATGRTRRRTPTAKGPTWWGAIARCPTNAWSTISSRRWDRRPAPTRSCATMRRGCTNSRERMGSRRDLRH